MATDTKAKPPGEAGQSTSKSTSEREGTLMLPAQLSKRLDSMSHVSKDGKRVNGLYRLIGYPQLWMEASANIHANKGATTRGADNLTLDGFSEERILHHIHLIKNGSYQPNPVRRTYIPKRNGKMRPLGIPSGNDKLTQEVCRMILERIFEPIFSDDSHGFRKEKSCHTALECIHKRWTGVKWFVSVDIEGFFDNVDHITMICILEKYIDDPKFINMIRDMLKAGYLEDWKYHSTYSGAPQGGISSPLLSNIYLHELDIFVARLANDFDRGKKRNLNLVYHRLSRNIQTLYKKVDLLKSQGKITEADEVIQTLKTMIEERSKFPSGDPFDADYKRLRYCRYADDFIFGIIGSKKDAITLKDEVENFLRLNLSLSISAEKSQVVKATDGIVYLGYGVRNFSPTRKTRGVRGRRRVLRKAGSDLMQLYIPRRKIVTFCQKHGYGNYDQRSTTHRPGLLYREDVEIVMAYN